MPRIAYASAPDVLHHLTLAATFTATSRPNATTVHHQLLNASDELDLALRAADYTVPVATTATAAWDQLNHWAAVGGAMYSTAAHPAGRDSKHLEFLERRWTAILTAIREGEVSLDAAQDTGVSLARHAAQGAEPTGIASPYFTRTFVAGV